MTSAAILLVQDVEGPDCGLAAEIFVDDPQALKNMAVAAILNPFYWSAKARIGARALVRISVGDDERTMTTEQFEAEFADAMPWA